MLDLYYVSNKTNAPSGVSLFNRTTLNRNDLLTALPFYNKPFIKLTEEPYYFNYESIIDHVYDYNTIDNKNTQKISSVFNPLTEETYPLVVKASTQAEVETAFQNLDVLLEYDIQTSQPGYFVLSDGNQEWYTRGYILGFNKSMWQYNMGLCVADVTIVFEDKAWTRLLFMDYTSGTKITSDHSKGVREFDLSSFKLERPCDFIIRVKPFLLDHSRSYGNYRRDYYYLYGDNQGWEDDSYGLNVAIANNYSDNMRWDWYNVANINLLSGRMGTFSPGTELGGNYCEDDVGINGYQTQTETSPYALGAHPYVPYMEINTKYKTITYEHGWNSAAGIRDPEEHQSTDLFQYRYNDTTLSNPYYYTHLYDAQINADLSRFRKLIGDNNGKVRITTFIEPRLENKYGQIPTISEFGRNVPQVLVDGSVISDSESDFYDFPYEVYIYDERRTPVWN